MANREYLSTSAGSLRRERAAVTSSGATDADLLVALNTEGQIDASMLPTDVMRASVYDADGNGVVDHVAWDGVTGKPEASVASIDAAVTKSHDHVNAAILNATTESFTTALKSEYDILKTGKQDVLGFVPENTTNKGVANGYASLDGLGKVPVTQLPSDFATTCTIVNTITERDALAGVKKADRVLVKDASLDPTVSSGWAEYVYDETSTWFKMSEGESMDISLDWSHVENKPTSSTVSIDQAVTDAHTHANKTILDQTDASFTQTLQTKYDGYETSKQDALSFTPEDVSKKGIADGYASLGTDGKVPASQLPDAAPANPITYYRIKLSRTASVAWTQEHVVEAPAGWVIGGTITDLHIDHGIPNKYGVFLHGVVTEAVPPIVRPSPVWDSNSQTANYRLTNDYVTDSYSRVRASGVSALSYILILGLIDQ